MGDVLETYDEWLDKPDSVALVKREFLMPVEGRDAVVFPATYAPSDDKKFRGGYNIDRFGDGSENVCTIDSVGSQANRIEPLFLESGYRDLVPQIVVTAGNKSVNLLEAGHRAGDAIVRCSSLKADLRNAFERVLMGDAEALAKIAPTSLLFGVWDSRDTQAKMPRLLSSSIMAFNVRELTRSAQYNPATEYSEGDDPLLSEPEDLRDASGRVDGKHPFAQRGFAHVPASASPGGVIATGGIRRNVALHLAALRQLRVGNDETKSKALRRYILGLGLVAFTYLPTGYLRQGCDLVIDCDRPKEMVVVRRDGKRVPSTEEHKTALAFARAAAAAFGVGESRSVTFDKGAAQADLAEAKKAKSSKKKK